MSLLFMVLLGILVRTDWLKLELEYLGCNVFVPKFPTPEGQTLEAWSDIFEEYLQYLDGDSILIGHSLGSAFILSILERINMPIMAAFFVSGFTGSLGDPKFDKINSEFASRQFKWDLIRNNCRRFFIIHSDNDPYVPIEKAQELAGKLAAEPTIISGGGYFNTAAGYSKFPFLLKQIKFLL